MAKNSKRRSNFGQRIGLGIILVMLGIQLSLLLIVLFQNATGAWPESAQLIGGLLLASLWHGLAILAFGSVLLLVSTIFEMRQLKRQRFDSFQVRKP